MDHQTFDTVTRLFSAAGSRRTAWRALLGLGLSGAAMGGSGRVRAAPKRRPAETCGDGRVCHGDSCCGGECCPGRCFVGDEGEFCCTQSHTPPGAVCVNPDPEDKAHKLVCCPVGGPGEERCACAAGGLIAGSYRRR